jgi:hypothetical protein
MTTVVDFFPQAQLAEAAYANFFSNSGALLTADVDVTAALKDRDNNMSFSDAQADAFVKTWRVVDHIPDTKAGFSATIFQNRQTLAYHLAIRGSTDMADFSQDATLIARDGIAIHQIVDLCNFWQRATTPMARGSYRAARVVTYDGFGTTSVPIGISPYRINQRGQSHLTF